TSRQMGGDEAARARSRTRRASSTRSSARNGSFPSAGPSGSQLQSRSKSRKNGTSASSRDSATSRASAPRSRAQKWAAKGAGDGHLPVGERLPPAREGEGERALRVRRESDELVDGLRRAAQAREEPHVPHLWPARLDRVIGDGKSGSRADEVVGSVEPGGAERSEEVLLLDEEPPLDPHLLGGSSERAGEKQREDPHRELSCNRQPRDASQRRPSLPGW